MTIERDYLNLLQGRRRKGCRVCVGLDPDVGKIISRNGWGNDESRETLAQAQFALCKQIVDATRDFALVYKINFAFFGATRGYGRMCELIAYIKKVAPDVPIILDVKRGDVGPTATQYAEEAYGAFGADAVTVNPYMGWDAIEPFVRPGKFVYVLCKTSNPSSSEFQDRIVQVEHADIADFRHDNAPLFEYVAWRAANRWPNKKQIGLVVGATFPHELAEVRHIVGPRKELLIPGVGNQGGSATEAVAIGGKCIAVNSSSGIMFADDPEVAAIRLAHEMLVAEVARS